MTFRVIKEEGKYECYEEYEEEYLEAVIHDFVFRIRVLRYTHSSS